MKLLSIRQPWAELIVRGVKDVENRSWSTRFRGPLLIHASGTPGFQEDFDRLGVSAGDVPQGSIVGVANVVACTRRRTSPWHEAGNWGWYLEGARRFLKPIPWKAMVGLQDVPDRTVARALLSAKADRPARTRPASTPRDLTIFSWGYAGWGNATNRLVPLVDQAEAYRKYAPPIFVDIRLQRTVRAKGFREAAFEELLGHERYRWMRSLGNPEIREGQRAKRRVDCPAAVEQLIDLALDAAHLRRRVIYFCSCPHPDPATACHRFDVAGLLRTAAKRRGLRLQVHEWPGEKARRWPVPLKVSGRAFDAALAGRTSVPLPRAAHKGKFASLPWGTVVELLWGTERQLVSVGPLRVERGKPVLPIFLPLQQAGESVRSILRRVRRKRRALKLDR